MIKYNEIHVDKCLEMETGENFKTGNTKKKSTFRAFARRAKKNTKL